MNYFSFYKGGLALYCLIFTGFLLSFSPVYSRNFRNFKMLPYQRHLAEGTVSDGSSPLPGVTITLKSNKNSTVITDYNGHYSLEASPKDTLIVSFIGFKTKFIPVNERTKIDIKLDYDTTTLQEVRVNAGYYSVKERDRTGSIARITSKDIETQPVTNMLATMQGRMAGVSITQTTGNPGGGFDIKIRGQNSLRIGANNPLYVIDGVPYSADPIGTGSPSAVLPTQPSPLSSINPEQIESIEVLKDADATSIYGSRGANGVVLITTKKGKSGKTTFTAKINTGVAVVTRFMDLMSTEQYLEMRKLAYVNDGITTIPASAYDVNGTWSTDRYTDWQKELLGGTADMTNIQGSLGGGNQQTQFILNTNFNRQGTVFPGTFQYKKGGVHLNINHESENKKFKIGINLGGTFQDNSLPQTDFMRETYSIAPNAPKLYKADGTLNWENNTFSNPLRNLQGGYKAVASDFIGNILLSYNITKDISIQSNIGGTWLYNEEKNTSPASMLNPALGNGPESSSLMSGSLKRSSWIFEPQLNWNKSLQASKLSILAGATFQSQNSAQDLFYGYGFTSDALISNIGSAASVSTLFSNKTEYKYHAVYARLNYSLRDKYILNLTGRRDGSSRFGPENRFSNFGAAGIAWLFSKENFLKNSTVLSFGKLRASYGTTGSDNIGDYQYLNTYSVSSARYNAITGLQPSRLFNPDFGWESNKKLEAALEIGFLSDRIFFTVAYYNNKSSNQLTGIPLPGTTGFTTLQANLDAVVQNTGQEFTLRTVNIQRKTWSWETNLNISFARSKLLEFPNLAGSTYANTLEVGKSINIKKVYHYTGVNPQTGIYTFQDINNDGLLTASEDKKAVIDLNPQYFGGLQNTVKFKNWQLDFLFQLVKQKNFNGTSYFAMPGTRGNQLAETAQNWRKPGDSSLYQRYTSGANSAAAAAYYNYFESDGAISDASFIRLKNISLSYDVPLKDLKCRVFFEGQNLLTFTKYNGADPEFTSLGYLPPLKVFSAGLQFNF